MIDTLDILRNIKNIYASDNVVSSLVNMEKVLDDVNIYAYQNWNKGELVEGPQVTKYDTTATFMWEQNEMPDPDAGKRITNLGGQVAFKKDIKLVPRKIKTYSDYRPGTRKGKLDEIPVWLVKITIPNTVIEDFNAETRMTQTVSGSQVDEFQSPQDQVEMYNHVSPEVVIDAFQAKLGRDEDVSVIQFQSDNKDVAADLVSFVESGHDYVLDADFSAAKNKQKMYNIFVELERCESLPNNIMELVRDMENVTGILPWKFKFYKNEEFHSMNETNLNSLIPTTAEQYQFLTDDTTDEDINTLFKESKVTVRRSGKNLVMSKIYNKHKFVLEAVNVSTKNGVYRIDESSTAQTQYLNNWLGGGWHIVKVDDMFKVSKEDKNIIVKAEDL